MKISVIKNFINKYIFSNRKNIDSTASLLLQDIDFRKVSLEDVPLADIFQNQNYSQMVSGIKNDLFKREFALSFLNTNPMNEKTYAKLSLVKLQAIRAQMDSEFIRDAEVLVSASKILKEVFDMRYGENKYVFVSIGRSLSAAANCLGFLGVDARQVPLSGCRGSLKDIDKIVNTMLEHVGFKDYKSFLCETLPKNSNRRYLFCDFMNSGATLSVFKTLLNHPKVHLGSKRDQYIGINNKYLCNNIDCDSEEYKSVVMDFYHRLLGQGFDVYADVNYYHYASLNPPDTGLKPRCPQQNKLMRFCMLDILNFSKSIE
ncbi:hypothetical protein HDR58_11220 [bacterium]|nr:hypothetical protein [bacterium]